MFRYHLADPVGQGCYGSVHAATFKATGRAVAIKVVQNSKSTPNIDGLPCAAYRELKALQRLQSHPHIITLHEAFAHGSHLCLVTDLMYTDLAAVMKACPGRYRFGESAVKCIGTMLLRGVAHIHRKGLIHRDVKPSNLLLTRGGVLKIGDFGQARGYRRNTDISSDMTHEVGTRWYRPPELLLGCRRYSNAVDMWSTGCVIGELMYGSPLFPGTTEIDQIVRIYQFLGTPDDETWPQRTSMPDWSKLQVNYAPGKDLSDAFPDATPEALSLVSSLVMYNEELRLSAEDALRHEFFSVPPAPLHPEELWLPKKVKNAASPKTVWDTLQQNIEDARAGKEVPRERMGKMVWRPGVPVMIPEEQDDDRAFSAPAEVSASESFSSVDYREGTVQGEVERDELGQRHHSPTEESEEYEDEEQGGSEEEEEEEEEEVEEGDENQADLDPHNAAAVHPHAIPRPPSSERLTPSNPTR